MLNRITWITVVILELIHAFGVSDRKGGALLLLSKPLGVQQPIHSAAAARVKLGETE